METGMEKATLMWIMLAKCKAHQPSNIIESTSVPEKAVTTKAKRDIP